MAHVELVQLPQITNNDKNFLNALNKNLLRIKAALDDALSRTGVEPNQMEELLDMNGKRIANVGDPVEDTDVVTKAYINSVIAAAQQAIADIDNIIIGARQALQNWASEYIYPVAQAAVDQAQTYAQAAETAKTAAQAAQASVESLFNQEAVQTLLQHIDAVIDIVDHIDAIEDVADMATQVQSLADNMTKIVAVANDIDAINAVKNALPTITAVNSALTTISAVYNKLSDITAVADGLDDIAAVKDKLTVIETVSESLEDISTCATHISAIIAAPTEAEKARKWAEGTDQEVGPLGGTHSSKGWAEYAASIVTGVKIYGGGYNAETGVATLSNSAKVRLGTDLSTITLTNDTTPITGYAANESIEYVVTAAGSFAGHVLRENDILWSSGAGWHKIDNSETVIADASEDTKGILKLATTAEALAGTDNTKAMTAAKTKAAIEELAPMPTVLTTTGESGTFTEAQMALINDHTKISNDGELYVLSNKNSTSIYKTFINTDVGSDDKVAFKAIYVNCSTDDINYGSWTRESVETPGTEYTAGTGIKILGNAISVISPTLINNNANATDALSVGRGALAFNNSVAVGADSVTQSENCIAIGKGCGAGSLGQYAIAIGTGASAATRGCIQIGNGVGGEAGTLNIALTTDGETFNNYELLGSDGHVPAARLASSGTTGQVLKKTTDGAEWGDVAAQPTYDSATETIEF